MHLYTGGSVSPIKVVKRLLNSNRSSELPTVFRQWLAETFVSFFDSKKQADLNRALKDSSAMVACDYKKRISEVKTQESSHSGRTSGNVFRQYSRAFLLQVCLNDLPEALFDVMMENKDGERTVKQHKKIKIEGADVSDLLINFLREILYLFNGEKFITSSCEIIEFSNKELQARLTGELFNYTKHLIKTEIKAVTYSGLTVERVKSGWKARVIFDV